MSPLARNLIVLGKKLLDELYDKRFLLLSADDGRTHFVPLGKFSEPSGFECRAGQVVSLSAPESRHKKAEEVISDYLKGKEGEFSLESFREAVRQKVSSKLWKLPQNATVDEYAEFFKARCETLEKASIIKRIDDGALACAKRCRTKGTKI